MRRLTVLYHKTVPRVEYSLTHTHIPTPRQNLHHFTMVWPRHELHISIYLVTIGLLLSYSTMEAIYNLLSIFYIVHVVCPHLRQQVMGPAQRRAGTTVSILYSISIIVLLSQIQPADASPLPKTDIPALEGEANYKRWASLVRNSLIVLGLWYTIDNPEPDAEYETIITGVATETEEARTRQGPQTNKAEIRKWEEDDAK